jgi:hypothetical protein
LISSSNLSRATSPPDNINQSLLNFKVRFEETCGDVHQVVANYIADLQPSSTTDQVQAAWNGKVTFNGKDYVIGSLADPQNAFPLPNTDSYNTMSAAALFSLKQSIWVYLLKLKYKVYTWTPNHNIVPGNQGTQPTGWMQSQYAKYPGRYYTAAWSPATKCRGAGWSMSEFTLGDYPSPYADNAIPDSIAAPLFIDSTPGTIINATGLYTREQVFTKLGLPTGDYTWAQPIVQAVDPEPAPGTEPPQPQHSVAYLRAMSEGKTLTQLIATEGREPLQARVIALAQQDPNFAYELQRRPYQTISHFLGVQIDPAIHLNVTVETEDTFGIVVPVLSKPSS